MKLFFHDLANMQPLEQVVIRSVAPGFYPLLVLLAGEERLVWEGDRSPLSRRNITALREKLAGLAIGKLALRHESAYDEMVGQPLRDGANRLEVPVSRDVYPVLDRGGEAS